MPILTVIPARMAASRLPGKPLADIHGTPMIVHVWQRALAAELGPVLVATDNAQIAKAIEAVGGTAVMTSPDHPSGSDRIWEAVQRFDPDGANDAILNLQGDLPTIDAATVRACAETRAATGADIATLAAQIRSEAEHSDPNVVKVVGAHQTLASGDGRAPEGSPRKDSALKEWQRALYFTRATAPAGPGPRYHHIGIYLYGRAALERFVQLPPSPLEQRERLEQLRALEAGMTIAVGIVDAVPRGVDTPDDLTWARSVLAP